MRQGTSATGPGKVPFQNYHHSVVSPIVHLFPAGISIICRTQAVNGVDGATWNKVTENIEICQPGNGKGLSLPPPLLQHLSEKGDDSEVKMVLNSGIILPPGARVDLKKVHVHRDVNITKSQSLRELQQLLNWTTSGAPG